MTTYGLKIYITAQPYEQALLKAQPLFRVPKEMPDGRIALHPVVQCPPTLCEAGVGRAVVVDTDGMHLASTGRAESGHKLSTLRP